MSKRKRENKTAKMLRKKVQKMDGNWGEAEKINVKVFEWSIQMFWLNILHTFQFPIPANTHIRALRWYTQHANQLWGAHSCFHAHWIYGYNNANWNQYVIGIGDNLKIVKRKIKRTCMCGNRNWKTKSNIWCQCK